jgi:CheY-like chemotaxis protein
MTSTSDKIKTIRKARGLSQEELARNLSVSFPTVNAWERGKCQPYPRHQRAIDELFRDVMGERERRVVLIVEDDQASGMVLADYVEMALPEWKSEIVNNGYDAILKIGHLKPGIVLLDIMMPEIDGLEVFARIKKMDQLKETYVIFVTAATDEAILERARRAGAFGLIQKPLQRQEIVDALQSAARVEA